MRLKAQNNKTLFVLLPLLALSMILSLWAPDALSTRRPQKDFAGIPAKGGNYVGAHRHEAPADHETFFSAIFKFIVTCNPFKKGTSY